MKLFIKNMVSVSCKIVVKSELEKLGLGYTIIELGEVNIIKNISGKSCHALKIALHKSGFELIDDKKAIIIEKIKNVIVEMVHYRELPLKMKISCYLSEKLKYDYTYISNLFSEVKGVTIEQFIIAHKIERVKELLLYNELTLKEISVKLFYCNEAHLSSQFKKVTGFTPSIFKKMKIKNLIALENL
jgi:YesN/AraC family two-component response regulator